MIGRFQPDPTVLALIIIGLVARAALHRQRDNLLPGILQFQPWPQPAEGTLARFQNDRELHWREHGAALADS